jgi:hypothetical protein
MPKIPVALIWILLPKPVKGLEVISLFSCGLATMKPLGALDSDITAITMLA